MRKFEIVMKFLLKYCLIEILGKSGKVWFETGKNWYKRVIRFEKEFRTAVEHWNQYKKTNNMKI